MLKRYFKVNPNKFAVVQVPPPLSGAVYFWGRVGSGKTTSLMSLAQKYHDHSGRNYKIFDLYGGERNEHLYWCFKSQDLDYWKKNKKRLTLDKEGPKQYKVHLLYPYFNELTPNKLPNSPPNIKSSIFTIPFKSLTKDDVNLVVGNLSDNFAINFRESIELINKKDNCARINYKINKKLGENNSLYRGFFKPLLKNKFLQEENFSYNFDIKEELKNKEIISVLCLEFVPKEFHMFIMGWILRNINKLIDEGRNLGKNIILMREVAEFFRATDSAIVPDNKKIFRAQLAQYVRMGRRGVHLFADCQSPNETRGIVSGGSDLTVLCQMTSETDIEEATSLLYRDNLMTKMQRSQLSTLKPGEVMFVEAGKRVVKRYILLPRTMYWKPGYRNFYTNIWEKMNGNWLNIKNIKEEIENNYKETMKEIEEEIKIKKFEENENKKKEKERKETEEEDELFRKTQREIDIKEKVTKMKEESKERSQEQKRKRKESRIIEKSIKKKKEKLKNNIYKDENIEENKEEKLTKEDVEKALEEYQKNKHY